MKVKQFINDYFSKDELKDLCYNEDLRVGGRKEELVSRLRGKANYSILDFLWYSVKDDLKFISSDLGLRVGGTAEDLRSRILNSIVDDWTQRDWESEKKRIEKRKHKYRAKGKKALRESFFEIYPSTSVREKISTQKRIEKPAKTRSLKGASELPLLIANIHDWIPRIRYPNESGYQSDLVSYLEYQCGYKAKLESGDDRADIMVDGIYPIELKKSPRKGDYHRLIGQLADYVASSGTAIAIICDVKRLGQFQDFKEQIEELFSNNVILLMK